MKKIKKINTICNRAAALGCVEDIQIEIKGNYDFFYEYLKMFPQRSMVKALRSASLLGKIFVTGMEGDTAPTYQAYVLGVLKALQKYDWDDRHTGTTLACGRRRRMVYRESVHHGSQRTGGFF